MLGGEGSRGERLGWVCDLGSSDRGGGGQQCGKSDKMHGEDWEDQQMKTRGEEQTLTLSNTAYPRSL